VEPLSDYLSQLASAKPTPGGGSAAAVVAACGAALVAMVARICAANPKYAQHAALCNELVERADELRNQLLAARKRDETAYDGVVAATAMPRATDGEKAKRSQALESALTQAATEPLNASVLALEVLRAAQRALELRNPHLASDLVSAAEFGSAALAAFAQNVRVNHRFMQNAEIVQTQAKALDDNIAESHALLQQVRDQAAAAPG
jgi:methenyltetrahydrofolate cyclohydrolase